jgi:hypothetical protein
MCILYAYKLSLKVSSKCIHPNYYFYCFECVHRVCPNLSSAPCITRVGGKSFRFFVTLNSATNYFFVKIVRETWISNAVPSCVTDHVALFKKGFYVAYPVRYPPYVPVFCKFLCLFLFEGTFTSFIKDNKS